MFAGSGGGGGELDGTELEEEVGGRGFDGGGAGMRDGITDYWTAVDGITDGIMLLSIDLSYLSCPSCCAMYPFTTEWSFAFPI